MDELNQPTASSLAAPEKGKLALGHLIGPAVLVALITAIVGLLVHYFWKEPLFVADGTTATTIQKQLNETVKTELAEAAKKKQEDATKKNLVDSLKQTLDYAVQDYKESLGKLNSNIVLQALLVGIAILLVIRRSDDLTLFDNHIPLSWLHFFLPILLVYAWLSFGFTLHALIDDRVRGANIIQKVSELDPGFQVVADFQKARFQDAGFVDGWFISFVEKKGSAQYSGIYSTKPFFSLSTPIFLIVVMGTLVTATNASILAITAIGCRRYLNLGRYPLVLYYLAPLLPLVFLLVSHFQFAYGGDNRNKLQLYAGFAIPLMMMILLGLSAFFDRALHPDSLTAFRVRPRAPAPSAKPKPPAECGPEAKPENQTTLTKP